MEDRELLELASKAAGAKMTDYSDGSTDHWIIEHTRSRWLSWSPLTDDGDALRLAVSLQLSIRNEHVSAGSAYCTDSSDKDYPVVDSGDSEDHVISSDYAATRRAIVLAAAEIGKLIP